MRRGLVAEFDREAKEDVSDEGLFRQIHRLNHFFHPANANHVKRLLDLGRILLKKVDVVTAAMRKDPTVAHAMKKVIRHCFRCLNLPDAKVAVPLRVIEVRLHKDLLRNYLSMTVANCQSTFSLIDLHGHFKIHGC